MIPPGADLGPWIERLVDGCCDGAERRDLLLRLETEPDGWRQCALAFLEDQALRSALARRPAALPAPVPATLPAPAVIATLPARPAPVPVPAPSRAGTAGRWLVAASLMAAAFLVGSFRGRVERPADVQLPGPPVVQADLKAKPADDATIRMVGWASVAEPGQPERQLPILSGDGIDDAWLRAQPSTVPDYVRSQWERRGYQVAERRQVLSLNLEDGRRLAIPFDGVEVEYVGQSTY